MSRVQTYLQHPLRPLGDSMLPQSMPMPTIYSNVPEVPSAEHSYRNPYRVAPTVGIYSEMGTM